MTRRMTVQDATAPDSVRCCPVSNGTTPGPTTTRARAAVEQDASEVVERPNLSDHAEQTVTMQQERDGVVRRITWPDDHCKRTYAYDTKENALAFIDNVSRELEMQMASK